MDIGYDIFATAVSVAFFAFIGVLCIAFAMVCMVSAWSFCKLLIHFTRYLLK